MNYSTQSESANPSSAHSKATQNAKVWELWGSSSGIIKLNYLFWGDQTMQMVLVLTRDFPPKDNALFGFVISWPLFILYCPFTQSISPLWLYCIYEGGRLRSEEASRIETSWGHGLESPKLWRALRSPFIGSNIGAFGSSVLENLTFSFCWKSWLLFCFFAWMIRAVLFLFVLSYDSPTNVHNFCVSSAVTTRCLWNRLGWFLRIPK